jgi:hypothetical protein
MPQVSNGDDLFGTHRLEYRILGLTCGVYGTDSIML